MEYYEKTYKCYKFLGLMMTIGFGCMEKLWNILCAYAPKINMPEKTWLAICFLNVFCYEFIFVKQQLSIKYQTN